MSNNKFDGYPDELINQWIHAAKNQLNDFELSVKIRQGMIADYQAELDRRTLAAYWEAHPELTPVTVGDKLLITQEFIDHKQEVVREGNSYDSGELYEIQYFDLESEYCYIHSGSSVTGCPIEIASVMRRAYLEQQQETK